MFFALLIFARILFAACMVFIIGYIYGPFSKRRGLTIGARVAAIAIIFAFIMMNIFAFHEHAPRPGRWQQRGLGDHCSARHHEDHELKR